MMQANDYATLKRLNAIGVSPPAKWVVRRRLMAWGDVVQCDQELYYVLSLS